MPEEELTARLRGFSPARPGLTRDEMLFGMGCSKGRAGRCHRVWRWLAIGLGVTQLCLLAAGRFPRSESMPVEQPAVLPAPIQGLEERLYEIHSGSFGLQLRTLDEDALPSPSAEPESSTVQGPDLMAGKISEILFESH